MRIKTFARNFLINSSLVFVVSAVVTFFWNLLFHSDGSVDWKTSWQLAIILGIVFALSTPKER